MMQGNGSVVLIPRAFYGRRRRPESSPLGMSARAINVDAVQRYMSADLSHTVRHPSQARISSSQRPAGSSIISDSSVH